MSDRKIRISNLLAVISSLFVYMEWAQNGKTFLVAGEVEVFRKLFTDPVSVLHPLVILPLTGQLLLLLSLLQTKHLKRLTYAGIGLLSVLLMFILFVGILSLNVKMLLSLIPFLLFSVFSILHSWGRTSLH